MADFNILSSDLDLLEKANRVAREFARPFLREDVVGVVFLGAIARGYYDPSADIDIALFKKPGADISLESQFLHVDGLEVHCHLGDYEVEQSAAWDMSKRWTYAQGQIYFDPQGKIARLLEEKVPLRPEERRWLIMSGLTLSEWYVNRLTQLWVERGNIISAHHMVAQGLVYFFDLLFGWNHQLVPDMKWRYYCVEKLPLLPPNFQAGVQETMRLEDFSLEELGRRKQAFMEMWQHMLPLVEQEVGLPYPKIVELV